MRSIINEHIFYHRNAGLNIMAENKTQIDVVDEGNAPFKIGNTKLLMPVLVTDCVDGITAGVDFLTSYVNGTSRRRHSLLVDSYSCCIAATDNVSVRARLFSNILVSLLGL